MSKLYVFGIGGTGSRVLRSLTMLLASGVKCDADIIVPVIIDPDDSGADKTRTIDLMNNYRAVRSKLEFNQHNRNRFFRTEIKLYKVYSLVVKICQLAAFAYGSPYLHASGECFFDNKAANEATGTCDKYLH